MPTQQSFTWGQSHPTEMCMAGCGKPQRQIVYEDGGVSWSAICGATACSDKMWGLVGASPN